MSVNEVQQVIEKVLPSIDESVIRQLATHLIDVSGLTGVDELEMVEEEDLKQFLKPIQCRKLLRAFRPKGKVLQKSILKPFVFSKN